MSADGRAGVFTWFGPDQWNSVEVEIVPVPEPGLSALWVSGLLALAACSRSERARRANQRAHAAPANAPGRVKLRMWPAKRCTKVTAPH
jgi:hypothetical protein